MDFFKDYPKDITPRVTCALSCFYDLLDEVEYLPGNNYQGPELLPMRSSTIDRYMQKKTFPFDDLDLIHLIKICDQTFRRITKEAKEK